MRAGWRGYRENCRGYDTVFCCSLAACEEVREVIVNVGRQADEEEGVDITARSKCECEGRHQQVMSQGGRLFRG